ncbi:hypothetical protein [Ralstonia pseudosolanacearum]|uniref:hypothetical protein n=1 Tax=Ralstonia pseudosolanacearum TaxID=1310165 RepID=UPI0026764FA5|nr:hypothetical protein [Ralstonia pseudosolanacearum]MDO3518152.1 hypothetical protein [Ralstonia pseudosolanacearum]MDO3540672.1 hypothetical protein [Ralstonia pseudosolanacearum]
MKNHTATTAERAGKLNAQPSLARFDNAKVATRFRRVLRESFSMDWVDFISGVLAMLCGAKRQDRGMWTLPDGFCVCADARDEIAVCVHETGWSRWRLPSRDGVVRSIDWSAPWLTRSPRGHLFYVIGSECRRIWSFSELVRIAEYLRTRTSGWRAA